MPLERLLIMMIIRIYLQSHWLRLSFKQAICFVMASACRTRKDGKLESLAEKIFIIFSGQIKFNFTEDIRIISKQNPSVQNSEICYLGDVRKTYNRFQMEKWI